MSQVLEKEPLIFEQFHPFISLEGLDSNKATSFLNFLQKLFERTPKYLWLPESCCGAVKIAKNARIISPNYLLGTETNVLMGLNHLWSVMKQQNQAELIIDPAGILDPELEVILPYFGALETCSFDGYPLINARKVYGRGEALTTDQEKNLLKHLRLLSR
ncbi:MAG: hypothetical protein V1808_02045 [Candidatus Daviesbacteria bacterium]